MSYECPHGIPLYQVKNFGCDGCLNDMVVNCRGIPLQDGDYSGCNAHETGASDCPMCGEFVRALNKTEALQ